MPNFDDVDYGKLIVNRVDDSIVSLANAAAILARQLFNARGAAGYPRASESGKPLNEGFSSEFSRAPGRPRA
jgi:hypothetical protein